jgi:hypothetical protein
MLLELDDRDTQLLRAALVQHIEELTRELARTDNFDYQHDLAGTVRRLEAIAGRLPGPATGARLGAASSR